MLNTREDLTAKYRKSEERPKHEQNNALFILKHCAEN